MEAWEADDMPDELREDFWQTVVDIETCGTATCAARLTARGIALPDPETMTDEELRAKLWDVLRGLAALGMYLDFTDHLSDRALYTLLARDLLINEAAPSSRLGSTFIDLGDSGEDTDDGLTYLKYYADEQFRQDWQAEFPDAALPEHVEPPYDRDQHMPVPDIPPRH
jgi:hypothetical protein